MKLFRLEVNRSWPRGICYVVAKDYDAAIETFREKNKYGVLGDAPRVKSVTESEDEVLVQETQP